MTLGEPSFLSDDFIALEDPDLELVTTSGYAKNGALCILERSIRPQVVTTITLPGLSDLWTLHSASGQDNHELIVVSQENRSIVRTFHYPWSDDISCPISPKTADWKIFLFVVLYYRSSMLMRISIK